METIVTNLTGLYRREVLNGRQYIVASTTMIVPGVLAGNAGPMYYPDSRIKQNPIVWNHQPIVVNHPLDDNKKPTSARSPQVLNQYGIGLLFNTQYHDRLMTETWFDIEAVRRVDNRILDALLANKLLEVSTGLFVVTEKAQANSVFNGKEYTHVVLDYTPDHLAVLPDSIGACSIKDGCGVNNSSNPVDTDEVLIDYRDGRLENTIYDPMIVDNIIGRMMGGSYRLYSKTGKNMGTFATYDEAREHEKKVNYFGNKDKKKDPYGEPVTTTNSSGGNHMPLTTEQRTEHIGFITANCDCWKGADDVKVLNGFTDEKLVSIKAGVEKSKATEMVANAAKKGFTDPNGNQLTFNPTTNAFEFKAKTPEVPAPTPTPTPTPTPANNGNTMTPAQWYASAPPEVQVAVSNAMEIVNTQKNDLVAQLTANVQDAAAKANAIAIYNGMSLQQLRTIASTMPAPVQQQANNSHLFNFFGGNAIAPVGNVDQNDRNDVFDVPVTNYNELASQHMTEYLGKRRGTQAA